MTDPRLAWCLLLGAYSVGWLMGRLDRKTQDDPRRRFNHENRHRQPEQPLAADLIRYSRWRSEQIERALRDEPIRLDDGPVQRGNGSGSPTTFRPD